MRGVVVGWVLSSSVLIGQTALYGQDTALPQEALVPSATGARTSSDAELVEAAAGRTAPTLAFAASVVKGARQSVADAPEHDPTYYELSFPGGDPGMERGAAADVIVRALRSAGVDMQQAVYEDVLRIPALYRVSSPDYSIDHRRVKNLARFLLRWGVSLSTTKQSEWMPGDLVVWSLNDSMQPNHIGVVTDAVGDSGFPLVVHHLPRYGSYSGYPAEEDVLFRWRVLGHYRVDPERLPASESESEPPSEPSPASPDVADGEPQQPPAPRNPASDQDAVPTKFAELEGQKRQQVSLGELLNQPPQSAEESAVAEVPDEGTVSSETEEDASSHAVPQTSRRTDKLSAPIPSLLAEAERQVHLAPTYDSSYQVLDYPLGDPAPDRGASVDLVIRSFRAAGVDLQQEVHDDVSSAPEAYGIEVADANIDHRRIRNLDRYFDRHSERLPVDSDFKPGDVVIWDVRGGTQPRHIGIVSDRMGPNGLPQVLHHLPKVGQFPGTPSSDDVLFRWRIVGHYRATDGQPGAVRLAAKDPLDSRLPPLEPQAPSVAVPAAPAAAVELARNDPGDRLGDAMAVGDFDGDGRDDLAVASPRRGALAGDSGSGRVMLFRGTPDGLVEWQDLFGDSKEADVGFGASLAAADFNGDGLDDLAVGAPGLPGAETSGWVYLLKGTASGLEQWERLGQAGLGKDLVGDLFGWSLAAGDINGDDLADLVVGAPGETPSRGLRSGQVFTFKGSTGRLVPWEKIGQEAIEVNEDGDLFGWAVALGDVTGDGLADLAVGAPGEGLGYRPASGAVFLYSGSPDGLLPLQNVGQLGLGRNEKGDDFGWSLVLTDFNHDNLADLVVGAPGEAFGSIPQSGWVFVFYGSSEGVLPWMSLGQDDIGLANEPLDRFGWSLSYGDFDGDGRDDLAIGTPGKVAEGRESEGSLLVCKGGRTDLVPWISVGKGASYTDGGGRFGTALVTGDFDGDRFQDLAVGAPGRNADAVVERGSVFLFKGAPSGFEHWLWRGESSWVSAATPADTEAVPDVATASDHQPLPVPLDEL